MELTAASASAITQANTAQQISITVAKKSLDAQKQQGAAALELLQSAAAAGQPQKSSTGGVDVTA